MPDTAATSPLFTETTLGRIEVSNRIAMAPMTRSRAGVERMANDLMAEYYRQRASAGLIITEATVVSDEAKGWQQSPSIESDAHAESWRRVVDAVHSEGGKIVMQLWHTGRASHSSFHEGGAPPVAPSAIKINGEGIQTPGGKQPYETPRALETEEIPRLIDDFRKASRRAKDVGFDGVEIHSANGYLLDEFLQSKTNRRTDDYGGSVENRTRLLLEIVGALTADWGAGRVAVRLSPNGVFNDMGSPDFREQFTYAGEQLDRFDLAYLHVMDGLAFGFHELGGPMTLDEFRRVFKGPLMGNCGYHKLSAEAAIGEGRADMIAIGRSFISNPDLVARYRNDWPLNEDADPSTLYSFDEKGYADYPAYRES